MAKSITLLFFVAVFFAGCTRDTPCGCVPPPVTGGNWKITLVQGGISGGARPLTDDEKNNVLYVSTDGHFACKNTVTGVTVAGTISISNFNSIYGDRPRYIFSPALPMYNEDFIILVDHPNGKMVFGDNKMDGYQTSFEVIP